MKFSGNGLYIEEYIKCRNCGYLIYEADMEKTVEDKKNALFCSEWCMKWFYSEEKEF